MPLNALVQYLQYLNHLLFFQVFLRFKPTSPPKLKTIHFTNPLNLYSPFTGEPSFGNNAVLLSHPLLFRRRVKMTPYQGSSPPYVTRSYPCNPRVLHLCALRCVHDIAFLSINKGRSIVPRYADMSPSRSFERLSYSERRFSTVLPGVLEGLLGFRKKPLGWYTLEIHCGPVSRSAYLFFGISSTELGSGLLLRSCDSHRSLV